MTAKEYYKSTRMVETRNWTLEMALNFAEEYAEALRKHAVSGRSEQLVCGRDIKTCVFYKDGKCTNKEYCKDQVEQTNCH